MKTKLTIALAVLTLAITGCTSLNNSVPSYPITPFSPSAIVPDVKVEGKIAGTASVKQILFFFTVGDNNEYADGVTYKVSGGGAQLPVQLPDLAAKAKAAAALKAVKDSGADLIVAPRYEIKTLSFGIYKEVSATVTGYKGTIKGFHQIKDEYLFD